MVAIYIDLITRDGRKAVEVRNAIQLGDKYYASPRKTLYSCAYDNNTGRMIAINRAMEFVKDLQVVAFHTDVKNSRAIWQ